MNKYRILKEQHAKAFNEFPKFFAFNDKQFEEGMAKLGLSADDTDKIYSIGYGGFYKKEDAPKFHEMNKRFAEEMKQAMEDEQFLYDMFYEELANHEFCITLDYDDTFDACGVTVEEVSNNPKMLNALKRAEKDYLANVEEA